MINALEINRCISGLIREKVATKTDVAKVVSDILGISLKAAYRRLNDEVMFAFVEVCLLGTTLGFGAGDIIPDERKTYKPKLILPLVEKEKNVTNVLEILSDLQNTLSIITGFPDAEIGSISDSFPCILYSHRREMVSIDFYYSLYSHFLEKTYRDFCNSASGKVLVDAIFDLHNEYFKSDSFCLIMSRQPVKIITQNLIYLKSIHAITQDEFESLKVSLGKVLDDLEQILNTGIWVNGRSKCEVYISDYILNSNLHNVWSSELSVSTIQTYFLGRDLSREKDRNNNIRYWHELVKNRSKLITGCSMPERVAFMDEQRLWLKNA